MPKSSSSKEKEKDPFKNPSPGGSKRRIVSVSSSSSENESEPDASKTPKKTRRSTVATHRNKALWAHFEIDPSVPVEKQTKDTPVCFLEIHEICESYL